MLYNICKAADLYGLSQEPECLAILTLLAIVRRDALLFMRQQHHRKLRLLKKHSSTRRSYDNIMKLSLVRFKTTFISFCS